MRLICPTIEILLSYSVNQFRNLKANSTELERSERAEHDHGEAEYDTAGGKGTLALGTGERIAGKEGRCGRCLYLR